MASRGRGFLYSNAQWTNAENSKTRGNWNHNYQNWYRKLHDTNQIKDFKTKGFILKKNVLHFENTFQPRKSNISDLKLDLSQCDTKKILHNKSNLDSWTFGTEKHISDIYGVKTSELRNKNLGTFGQKNVSEHITAECLKYEGPSFNDYREDIKKPVVQKNPIRSAKKNKPQSSIGIDLVSYDSFWILFRNCLFIKDIDKTATTNLENTRPDVNPTIDKSDQSVRTTLSPRGRQQSNNRYQKPNNEFQGENDFMGFNEEWSNPFCPQKRRCLGNSSQKHSPWSFSDQESHSSNQNSQTVNFTKECQPSDQKSQKSFTGFREEGQHYHQIRSQSFTNYMSGRQSSAQRNEEPMTVSRQQWQNINQRCQDPVPDSRRDWQQPSGPTYQEPSYDSRRNFQQPSDPMYQESSSDSRGHWKSGQGYQVDKRNNSRWEERCPDPLSGTRGRPPGNYMTPNQPTHHQGYKRKFQPEDTSVRPITRDQDGVHCKKSNFRKEDIPVESQSPLYYPLPGVHSSANRPTQGYKPDFQSSETLSRIEPSNQRSHEEAHFARDDFQMPVNKRPSVVSHCPVNNTWQNRLPEGHTSESGSSNPTQQGYKHQFQKDETSGRMTASNQKNLDEAQLGKSNLHEPDNKRFKIDSLAPLYHSWQSSIPESSTSASVYNQKNKKWFNNQSKEKTPKIWEKPMIEDAKNYTVLFQYLKKCNQPLEESHMEHVKKFVMEQYEEDQAKKPRRRWNPQFGEFIKNDKGLTVVCNNQKSMTWLIKRKIPKIDGKFIIACNALTPVKNIKLNFHIIKCSDSADVVMSKLDKCNRWVNFKQFRVLSSKYISGNISMVVQTDSRTVTKIKKMNWMARYDNQRIRIYKCKKKKSNAEGGNNEGGDSDSDGKEDIE